MITFDDLDDTAFLADLDGATGIKDLENALKQMYVAGQIPSYREDVHLSDIMKPLEYRGKPSFCMRQIILAAFFQPNVVIHPHPKVAIFERGKDMHERWQEKFHRSGKIVYRQGVYGLEAVHEATRIDEGIPSHLDWKLLFTPDVIVDMQDGVGVEIVEIKGYNQRTYIKMAKDKNPPTDAYVQNSMYMWLSGIHRGMIIVECKDNQQFFARRVAFDESVVEPFKHRIDQIDQLTAIHRQTGQLPPRICSSASEPRAIECSQCATCFMSKASRELKRKI